MDTYSLLREIADSWVLLAMFLFFAGVVAWAFRPGSTAVYRNISEIPLRDDDAPDFELGCTKQCDTCVCAKRKDTPHG